MIVTIDGPAGVGKSTVATKIAKDFHFFKLNSGLFYRALTHKFLQKGLNLQNQQGLVTEAEKTKITLIGGRIHLDGKDVENQLHRDTIDEHAAHVSSIIPLRHLINKSLQRITASLDLVAEGRDMGTVVFPQAEVKIFLDADITIRAERRFLQNKAPIPLPKIEASMRKRDTLDYQKEEGALRIAADATLIDSTSLTFLEVYGMISRLVNTRLSQIMQE